MCHYKGVTYIGHLIDVRTAYSGYSSCVDRIDQDQVVKEVVRVGNFIHSSLAHGNRLYSLTYKNLPKSSTLSVYGLHDGRFLTSWRHPKSMHAGQRMSVINGDHLAVGDWNGKQIIIYSLTGDVIRRVPLPHCLTMMSFGCMSSCGDDSVVISDYDENLVAMISLKDGSLIWSSDSVTAPRGIVHHPAGCILVSSGKRESVVISVLDDIDGISIINLSTPLYNVP